MSPVVVVMNHSAPFLCALQRRLKIEPFDTYLYHQNTNCIDEIVHLAPKVIILARRYGYPATDEKFIEIFHSIEKLKSVPIILSLMEHMQPLKNHYLGVTTVVTRADMSNLEQIINTLQQVVNSSLLG